MTTDKNFEMFACFDDSGKPIESHSRKEAHTQPLRFWHAVTNIWVINSKGMVLCTHRSSENEGNPNKWQTYAGGHVKDGDSFEETAIKELDEELGLNSKDGKLIFFKQTKREDGKHITAMFAFFWNGNPEDINMRDGEIDDAKWISFDEYIAEKNLHSEQWCNSINPEIYTGISKLRD